MADRPGQDRGTAPWHGPGHAYWRAVRELLDDPALGGPDPREQLAPGSDDAPWPGPLAAADLPGGLSRREFLRLLGASLALAGAGGCIEPPRERILPYTTRPPDVTPGIARAYATAMPLGGYGTGLLVESREGRPTKVEGNPLHPASLGAAGVFEQASVLQLYDPQRARGITRRGRPTTWTDFVQEFGRAAGGPGLGREGGGEGDGEGLRFLLEPTTSPLTASLIDRVRAAYPRARFTFYAPLASTAPVDATLGFFGRPAQPQYDFSAADLVLALDADFLASMPFHLRYARDWAARRRPASPEATMSRLYAVEGILTPTGAVADHRLRVRTGDVGGAAAAVLAELIRDPAALPAGAPAGLDAVLRTIAGAASIGAAGGRAGERWTRGIARDLGAHAGRSIVIAGERQPAAVHAMAHALNALLGNIGRTVRFTEPPLVDAGPAGLSLEALVDEMRAGAVATVAILGGNPVYDAPADLDFEAALARVRRTVYQGLYENETAAACEWFVPALHYLESWGDIRAWDGTASIVQPLIRPLYGGRGADDVLAAFPGEPDRTAYATLRGLWRERAGAADFEAFWDDALRRGVVAGTATAPLDVRPSWSGLTTLLDTLLASHAARAGRDRSDAAPAAGPRTGGARAPAADGGQADRGPADRGPADGRQADRPAGGALEVVFMQDSTVYDGRFANNAWLQELPDPLTKLTWDNAAIISPRTAAALGLDTGRLARLRLRGREATVPIFVLPGQADGCIGLPLGYGRQGAEAVARGVGVDAYRLRTAAAPYFAAGATLEPTAGRHPLATTQTHWTLEGRPVVLSATLARYRADPDFTREQRGPVRSLYRPFDYDAGDQWAMAIDLAACTGCSACVVACQAENNIPVVGRDGVLKSREMHWLRIDRYDTGDAERPGVAFQPMLCQHCEKAPCEYVCPVNATVHSPDGLNEMVYNRCIGTRFCSNNCPYKVRRFNWLDFNVNKPATLRMQMNPEVTVRARGVMEKCTFCVQRIRRTQIEARREGRSVRPGEVWTACQQACPMRAIWFGSATDPDDELLRRLRDPRRYAVLHELGTEPRVTYLARITNPNAALEA